MGISGLLPLLKSIHKPGSLKKYAGQTIGVDAYGWLHRGTASCVIDLALDKPTTKFVDFAMNRVRMLVHFGITPYLVFDGDYLPSKAGTEKERAERRKEARRVGLELLKMGKASQAHLELQKAVDVTPEMARLLIEELKHHNIQYIVAPYEADSQLAYLERQGIINGILSEDSDLLVFGAKCLITKLDKYGECVEVNRNHFTACREVSLVGWSDTDFRRMAILSGCDYLPGIGKMGLKTAYRMLRKHKTVERLVRAAQFEGQLKVPPGYMEAFNQAENTFLYQWVFCPRSNQLVNLTVPDSGVDIDEMPYIGKEVPPNVAFGVSRGDLHPHTKEPIIVAQKDRSKSKPLRPASRTPSITQTPDLKQTKPIDTFFRPRRTPLAELDPNSFTPSPSQQALLQQQQLNGGGWAAVLAPQSHPQSQQRSSFPRTAPQPPRRATSDSFARRASAPHPSKRQRLCSDGAFGTLDRDSDKPEITRSRFFNSSKPDPSPSINKSKKSQDQNFELWSDDSIEEAMAELADLDEVPSFRKEKVAVFKDDFQSSVNSDSQSTTLSRSITEMSQDISGILTPATSCSSPARESEEHSVFSAALSAQVKDLRSRFSYRSSSVASERSWLSKGPRGSTLLRSTSGPAASISQPTTHASQDPCSESNPLKAAELNGESNELEDSAWAAMETEVVVAASDIESPEKPKPTPASSREVEVKGSEDLLVPDSEEEGNSPHKPTLDLGRFAFLG
ncbi:PIN domain-like protein [Lindgomyces ingoldianus]|uniref:PIN domain-like protein n=1 Tax=Lindgomyces ingoldianus TaxID=673940 RepID=A0ACB6QWD7_9PLEO|nr:PIN domain-like protein [Lindgomyces ingoldianus]KAF2470390.1 PIN domain-like protein [Lindgomyces ingoldianus]